MKIVAIFQLNRLYLFLKDFLMQTIMVFIEFVTILLLFFFLSHNSCGILPGIKPTTPALEGKILTPGPPEIYIELLKEKSNKPQNLSCETPLYVT